MKISKMINVLMASVMLLVSCEENPYGPTGHVPSPKPEQPQEPTPEAPKPEIEGLYLGGDISVLQSYEDNKVPYYDQQGNIIPDVLQYMKGEQVGWNAQRVRLFVNPQQKSPDGSKDAQVCQNLDYVVRLCKRIKQEGFSLLLDFHYSDTWADPSNQWIPQEWAGLTEIELQTKVYQYTKECLQRLVDEGATPDFVQPGNEISYGMLWSTYADRNDRSNRCFYDSSQESWNRFANLLDQAAKAIREVCPKAGIVLHTERSGNLYSLKDIYGRLSKVDYDIIGLSYYPFWHGSLETLSKSLEGLAKEFPGKKVHIVETAYHYQWQAPDVEFDFSSIWPINPEGQAAFTRALVKELKKHENVTGLYWWFPEENGNGPNSAVLTNWVNRGLWDNESHRALPALYELKEFLRQ
jgi:arabinogalactan endo-1,4-beta-galactosidase